MIDVPVTKEGLIEAAHLGGRLRLDAIYHDSLSRCRDTAAAMLPSTLIRSEGPRPWKMGPGFEGHPITRASIHHAQWLVAHPNEAPYGGEPFGEWYEGWMRWIEDLGVGWASVGIVTHNRSIQALYATRGGVFHPRLYNVDGPDFLSVHYYHAGQIAPWGGRNVPRGIYLIRHARTNFGT